MVNVLFAYFFYRSYVAIILLLPISFGVMFYMEELIWEREKKMLKRQFREMILSVATNLKVGYSVENAFLETYADFIHLYGKKSKIFYELDAIKKGLSLNLTLESLLINFTKSCNIEEITEFVDIFIIARKTGGNLVEIIDSAVETITQKMEVDEEIDVITRAGRMEQQIMMVIPFFIITYVELTNKNFFVPLYHNLVGNLIMTVCLIVYLISVKISKKIISIRI